MKEQMELVLVSRPFQAVRIGLLLTIIVCFVDVAGSQPHTPREAELAIEAAHAAERVAALQGKLAKIEDAHFGERIAVIEEKVNWIEKAMNWLLVGVGGLILEAVRSAFLGRRKG